MAIELKPFRMPGALWEGAGVVDVVGDEAKRLGAGRVVLVCDPGIAASGLAEKVEARLADAGLEVDRYAQAMPEPTAASADACGEFVKAGGYQVVVGLGGGSSMDTAKLGAVLAVHGGATDGYLGNELIPGRGLPTVMIPTTGGTGAEATPNSVFKASKGGTKETAVSHYTIPDVAIVDPELTLSLPPLTTAATGMDALAHSVEAFTAKRATPHSDLYALESIRLVGAYLRRAVAQGDDLEARDGMIRASLYGGIALSQAGVNGVHAAAYPLSGRFGISHGVANGIMLAPVVAFNAPGHPRKFAQVARALGVREGDEATLAATCGDAVAKLAQDIDMPAHLADLGVTEDALAAMGKETTDIERLMVNNPRAMTPADVEAMYRSIF
jgi:alcohol dehydrogenase